MRNKVDAWKELSQIFCRYCEIEDPRGDREFANDANISVETVKFLRLPFGNNPPKDEVYKAVSVIRERLTRGMHCHVLDLVTEAYKTYEAVHVSSAASTRYFARSRPI